MSRANLYVRFPDGTVRSGIYNGTADLACETLYDSAEAAWEGWHTSRCDPGRDDTSEAFEVDIATDYGSGFAWRGKATRETVVAGFDPIEADDYEDGLPQWVVNAQRAALDPEQTI